MTVRADRRQTSGGVLADAAVRRVAFVRLRVGLGDLLCTVPTLRAVRRSRPDLHVTLVTWAEMAPVVDRMRSYVDDLLAFPGADGVPERPPEPHGWAPFVRRAHAQRYDVALQCYGNNPAANDVTAALGARHVGGFAPAGWTPPRDPHLHLPYPTDCHEVWRHLRLVHHLGVTLPGSADTMEFPTRQDDEKRHEALLRRHGLVPGRYAVLHPGSSASSRRWPTGRYAALGDALSAEGLRVVVTGVEDERALTSAVVDGMSAPAVDLTGHTGLGGLATLLRDGAVLVGNDTGTAHLAAAVGAASVTVFLPGDPVRWCHPGARHLGAWRDVGCNPCPHQRCPIDHRCATAITPGHVLSLARQAMRAAPRTSARP